MTPRTKMRMQDARDRAWTCAEIAAAWGYHLSAVKKNTHAERRGLSLFPGQRAMLRWSLATHAGMISVMVWAAHAGITRQAAEACIKRMQRKGYMERLPLSMLSASQRAAVGSAAVVWGLTRSGVRAAKDRLLVTA